MEPIFDKSFAGAEGMVRVWNATSGFLEVCEDGHLLNGQTSAWVESSAIVDALVADGSLVLLSGTAPKPNGNSKKKKQEAMPSSPEPEVQLVAPAVEESIPQEVTEAAPVVEVTNSENTQDSVSVETI